MANFIPGWNSPSNQALREWLHGDFQPGLKFRSAHRTKIVLQLDAQFQPGRKTQISMRKVSKTQSMRMLAFTFRPGIILVPRAAILLASARDRELWPAVKYVRMPVVQHFRSLSGPGECSARSINFNWCYGTSVNEIYHYLNDLDRILPRINEDLCGSKHKRGDPVWVKLVASYTFIVVRWVINSINKLQMHFPVNSFSVSSAQRTSYVLFCFIWFWDGRVAFRCGLTITLA